MEAPGQPRGRVGPSGFVPADPPAPRPERWHQCTDGVDNNGDGLVDCYERSCQRSRYCRKKMYFVTEPEGKTPGLRIDVGMGLALPNYRRPSAEVFSDRYMEDVPFDPDVGGTLALQLGYLFAPYFGAGIDLRVGATAATNETEGLIGVDDDEFKYRGAKGFGYAGGFLRGQIPLGRFVPYVNLSAGYSYAKFAWEVYSPNERWSDIRQNDLEELNFPRDRHEYSTRHFTMALEPGFDFFVRKRSIYLGASAWLPLFAGPVDESATDNVGVMFHVGFTPMWRERPQLKPEYEGALDPPDQVQVEPEPDPQ